MLTPQRRAAMDVHRRTGWGLRPLIGALAWVLAATLGWPAWSVAEAKPMRFAHLSVDEGLSQTSVFSMFQDRDGFVWLGTEDGLNRFDGQTVTVYKHDPQDPGSLPHDLVWSIAEDPSGDLWIGTEGGGLARWNRDTDRFTRFQHDPNDANSLSGDRVRIVLVDAEGAVWVGTKDAGLTRFEPQTGTFTRFGHSPEDPKSLSHEGVYALLQDRSGRVWVGTEGGLSRFDGAGGFERFSHDPEDGKSLSGDRIRALVEDDQGTVWVGTLDAGLNELPTGSEGFVRHRHEAKRAGSLADDCVHAVHRDRGGRLWVGTRSGLDLLQPDGTFAHYRHDPLNPASLGEDEVMSLLEDRGGVLWAGTRAGGVSRWNPATWAFGHVASSPSGDEDGLSHDYVTSFTEDTLGRLWVGTMGGGLDVFDREGGAVGHYRHDPARSGSLSDDRVMALSRGRSGAIWVGTMEGGLNRFDPQTGRFRVYRADETRPGRLSTNGVMSLFEDREGTLWVGTYRGGLNRYDHSSDSFTVYRHDDADPASLSSDIVTCVQEGPGGTIWVGTEGGGLNRLDRRSGEFQSFRHDRSRAASLSDDTVYSLHVDPEGTLWVGTRGGLGRLDSHAPATGEASFRTYTERDGLPSKVVYGIQPDGMGRLWLSTNMGLARFDPRTETFRDYSRTHGLQSNEFTFGAHFRTTRGELVFGGPQGFNAFFAETIPTNDNVPPVVLTSFLKSNRPAHGPTAPFALDDVTLGYKDDVVTFEFAALDYADPGRNRYVYKLEGFDPEWIDLGSVHRVTYTDLGHGEYVLRVKAANNDGVWNEEGLSLPVSVLPPPWRTWWAYLGYALLLAAAAVRVVRVQRKKATREAEYRRRLELEVEARTEELGRQNEKLETLNSQLVETSFTDSLTGLRNRRFLFEEVNKEMSLVHRNHRERARGLRDTADELIFMMVDLDWFKPINDTCGHAAGDRVLVQVKHLLEKACRDSDTLIRWGGDEFLVVGRVNDLDGVEAAAERIRSMIEGASFDLGDGQVAHITCSIGFTCYPAGTTETLGLSLEQVVSLADKALYSAKKAGRNAWVGLLGTSTTSVEGVLETLQTDPDTAPEDGVFEVRRSTDQHPAELAM